jgi:hypothetical protein
MLAHVVELWDMHTHHQMTGEASLPLRGADFIKVQRGEGGCRDPRRMRRNGCRLLSA